MRYPDLPNPDLLDRIPLAARPVLDVGCGAGALLASIGSGIPAPSSSGSSGSANRPRSPRRLDQVRVVDVEADPAPFELGAPLDCIVYWDVLEHLRDPWPVMQRHAAMLARDGTMLICVPNVEHWSFAARLLQGSWDYEETGLLDSTHLRWFSLESMRRQLVRLGLSPCDVHPRIFDAEKAEAFAAALAPALKALGVDEGGYAQRAAPLQYIWRVRKAPRTLFAVAGNMLKPVGGVSHVRVVHPIRALATDPSISAHIAGAGEIPVLATETPKVYVLHRPVLAGSRGLGIIRALVADAG